MANLDTLTYALYLRPVKDTQQHGDVFGRFLAATFPLQCFITVTAFGKAASVHLRAHC